MTGLTNTNTKRSEVHFTSSRCPRRHLNGCDGLQEMADDALESAERIIRGSMAVGVAVALCANGRRLREHEPTGDWGPELERKGFEEMCHSPIRSDAAQHYIWNALLGKDKLALVCVVGVALRCAVVERGVVCCVVVCYVVFCVMLAVFCAIVC